MLRVWNVSLVILTFFLTIFGTFMTRSGVVQSVHAFGEDRQLAWLFIGFMVVLLVVSFGLVIYRLPLLRARNDLESWASREAAFLVNNWILLFSAFFVLFATMFPTLSETVTGERLTVGPPFFNRWMLPIGLVLLLLTGIAPLLAWRKSTLSNLRCQFTWPTLLAAVTGVVLYALGFRVWVSGICFAFCAFVLGTLGQEFVRGARVRQGATGTDIVTALIGLVARSRRRYGGYIVHAGIVLMFLGFAGASYKLEEQVLLKPGQQIEVGRFMVRYDALRQSDDGQKQMLTAYMTVSKDGELVGQMYPARWFFRKHESEPTTEVAIRRSLSEDLYITLAGYELSDQTASFQITVNPLVNWIWVGFGVLALGTGIALLPESTFAFAAAKVPAGAATTTMLFLALALTALWVMPARAEQAAEPQQVIVVRSELERELQRSIICMCGTCGRKLLNECICLTASSMRDEIADLLDQGKTKDDVIQYFVAKFGSQEPLASPIDEGFNRLAWLFPYLIGISGALGVGVIAVRWSRQTSEHALPPEDTDPQLETRLDDELRNLD